MNIIKQSVSCVRAKELACRVAVRVPSTIDFHRLGPVQRRAERSRQAAERDGRRQVRGGRRARGGHHRRQDGRRAAAGARAARLGAEQRPPAATLGPTLLAATPRGARRRCQARRHIPEGARYPQQAHSGEVPEAER